MSILKKVGENDWPSNLTSKKYIKKLLSKNIYKEKIIDIFPSILCPSQKYIYENKLTTCCSKNNIILVLNVNNKNIILDGHHRAFNHLKSNRKIKSCILYVRSFHSHLLEYRNLQYINTWEDIILISKKNEAKFSIL